MPQPQQQPVRPMASTPAAANAAQMYAGLPANGTQHMALVSILNPHQVQFLFEQLRGQMPQVFGTMTVEYFARYLYSGNLANVPIVNQLLTMMASNIQQQRLQQQQQQQQQMLAAASGAAGGRPVASLAGMPGMQQALSPQQQLQLQQHQQQQQLQFQQQQQQQLQRVQLLQQQQKAAQAGGVRPLNPFMSPSLAHQSAAAAARPAGTPTPSQTGGQRGLKRKSVNSSPAPSVATPQQPLNKSPRVTSPQNRPASAVHQPTQLAMGSPNAAAPGAKSDSETAIATGSKSKSETLAAGPTADVKPGAVATEKPPTSADKTGPAVPSQIPLSSGATLAVPAAPASASMAEQQAASAAAMQSFLAGMTSPANQPNNAVPMSTSAAEAAAAALSIADKAAATTGSQTAAGNVTAAMAANLQNLNPAQ
ncbi:hypothetical protein LPJ61_005308, partial [Coemansia biformis]